MVGAALNSCESVYVLQIAEVTSIKCWISLPLPHRMSDIYWLDHFDECHFGVRSMASGHKKLTTCIVEFLM